MHTYIYIHTYTSRVNEYMYGNKYYILYSIRQLISCSFQALEFVMSSYPSLRNNVFPTED